MRSVDARTGIEWLERDECLALLAAEEIGRLAVVAGGIPYVFPVNYRLDGEAVVFRTDEGTKLTHGSRHPVCFEIDSFDRETKQGWSVVVAGRLEEVLSTDTEVMTRVLQLGIDPWVRGEKAHWVRLIARRVSGRRVAAPSPA